MEKTTMLQNAYDYITASSDMFNVCLVKQLIDGVVVPKYVSFQMWLDSSVVMFKLYLNDDLNTFRLMSDDKVVIKSFKLTEMVKLIKKQKFKYSSADITGTKKIVNL